MNNSEIINNLIDSRSQKLWQEINAHFTVSIEQTKDGNYGCFTLDEEAIIYIDFQNLCKDSFAHELLHAQMSMNGCYINGCLKIYMADSPVLSVLLKTELGDHIGNVLQHIRFYDLYLELGFDKTKFTIDYNAHKCTEAELSSLEFLYQNLSYSCLDTHLGKLFAVLCDPNPDLDYSSAKVKLRKLDPELYRISSNLVEQWKQTEIDNYRPAVTEFIGKLEKWVKRKQRYSVWVHKLVFDIRRLLN
ncbi:MAG: hypothetical protein JZU53_01320 [Paludibacter sp.]|nr:hypothetical protein [Paludibacter sp.]